MNLWQKWKLRKWQRRAQKGELPVMLSDYYGQATARPERSTRIADLRFVVFDTETSGLDRRRDVLLSVGAIAVQNMEIRLDDSLEMLVRQDGQELDARNITFHGLTPSELTTGYTPEAALATFLAYLGPDVLVGHHAAFDTGMIKNQMQDLAPGAFLFNPVLDTALLARRVENPHAATEEVDPKQFGLDQLCQRYGLDPGERHTAWGDALLTAELLLVLLRTLKDRGIKTLGELHPG